MARKKDREFDLHIWAKPENANMSALFTVSRASGGAVCFDMPIDEALDCIRREMEDEF